MKELFYSETDQTLFWIPNYYPDSSIGSSVSEMVDMLTELSKKFKKLIDGMGYDTTMIVVKTRFIDRSSRYKSMRVFYCELKEKPDCKGPFILGSDWSMWKWIEN